MLQIYNKTIHFILRDLYSNVLHKKKQYISFLKYFYSTHLNYKKNVLLLSLCWHGLTFKII